MNRLALLSTSALTLAWAQAALAASPIYDPSAIANTSTASAVSTPFQATATVTTTDTNDAAVAVINNQNQGTTATVASVTGCGITWAKLKSQAQAITGHAGSGNLEVWSAPAPSALAGCTITVTFTGSVDGAQISTFGINGLNSISSPLDANASAAVCTSASLSVPSAPAVSTTTANDLLIGAGFYAANGVVTANFTTSAWTLQYNYAFSGTVIDNQRAGSASKSVSTTQSGTAVDLTAAPVAPDAMILCGLAFAGTGGTATPTSPMLHGIRYRPMRVPNWQPGEQSYLEQPDPDGRWMNAYNGTQHAADARAWHDSDHLRFGLVFTDEDRVQTKRQLTFWRSVAGVNCSTDGHLTAPLGHPLFPTMTSAYAHAPSCQWSGRNYAAGATGLGAPQPVTATSAGGTSVLHFGAGNIPGYFTTGQSVHDLDDATNSIVPAGTTMTALNSPSPGDVSLSGNLASPGTSVGDNIGSFLLAENWTPPGCIGVRSDIHVLFVDGCSSGITLGSGLDLEGSGGWVFEDSSSCTGTVNFTNIIGKVGTNGNSVIRMSNCPTVHISYLTADGSSTEDGSDSLVSFNGAGITATIDHSQCLWAFSDCWDTSFNAAPGSLTLTNGAEYNTGTGGPAGAHPDLSQNFGNAFTTLIVNHETSYTTSAARAQGYGCDNGAPNTPCYFDVNGNLGVFPVAGGASISKYCDANLGDGATFIGCRNNYVVTPGATFGLATLHSFTGSGVTPDTSGNIDIVTGSILP